MYGIVHRNVKSNYFTGALIVLLLTLIMLLSPITVFAAPEPTGKAVTTEQAYKSLTQKVQGQVSLNSYELEGGGYLGGASLFVGNANDGYDLDVSAYETLTSDAQTKVVSDIAQASNSSVGTDGVTEATVQSFWKSLQAKSTVGSKFLNTILQNTKPDFVTANAIWKPFAGPVGVAMGVLAVMIMSFLGIVMVADIAYITLPPIRLFVSDVDGPGKIAKSKIFSHDALYAVQKAETLHDAGSPKQALGIYFKRRVFMLILLGICLLYLVQGSLFTLVGYILDLLVGFLGF